MAQTTNTPKEFVALRVSRKVLDEVRSIARREDESQAVVLRRLLTRGLDTERRSGDRPDQAA
jgi:hypothetical protein